MTRVFLQERKWFTRGWSPGELCGSEKGREAPASGPGRAHGKSRPAGSGPVGPREQKMQAVPGRSYEKTNRAALASEKGVRPAGAGPDRPVGKREQVAPA